jgi:hypothetical protein
MSHKNINIGAQGKVTPDPCTLSKANDVLYCNNHETHDYELSFDINGSPFAHVHYTVPAGAMHHHIGPPSNGKDGHSYDYHTKAKGSSAAADPTIIITK